MSVRFELYILFFLSNDIKKEWSGCERLINTYLYVPAHTGILAAAAV